MVQLALRYHPDKNPDNPESTEKVQVLAYVNSVFLHHIYHIHVSLCECFANVVVEYIVVFANS